MYLFIYLFIFVILFVCLQSVHAYIHHHVCKIELPLDILKSFPPPPPVIDCVRLKRHSYLFCYWLCLCYCFRFRLLLFCFGVVVLLSFLVYVVLGGFGGHWCITKGY